MTGAFKSALESTLLLRRVCFVEWVISTKSSSVIRETLNAYGVLYHVLPMLEISLSLRSNLLYLPYLIRNALKLRAILLRRKIDHLIVNDYYNIAGYVVKALGWHGRLHTYVRLIPASQNKILNFVWVWLSKTVSYSTIAVSEVVYKGLHFEGNKTLMYDPIGLSLTNINVFPVAARSAERVRFLYLGNYMAPKGQMDALTAFSIVCEFTQKVELVFFGSTMNRVKNTMFKSLLVESIRRFSLEAVVRVHDEAGSVENEILGSDIVLCFSRSESFSRVCLEGSALGKPVIATRCGGPEEIIIHEQTGLLVDVGNVEAMAAAMLELALNPDKRLILGQNAATIVRERFNNEQFVRNFLSLLA